MRGALILALAACGRLGFESSPSPAGDATMRDGRGDAILDDGSLVDDASTPADAMQLTCADQFLGSVVGTNIASGTTGGQGNDFPSCAGGGAAADVAYHWIAPQTATYRIDLCNSTDLVFDSALSVRGDTCTGPEIACSDDDCLTSLHGRVTIAAIAGRSYVILIDGSGGGETGSYRLSITQQ